MTSLKKTRGADRGLRPGLHGARSLPALSPFDSKIDDSNLDVTLVPAPDQTPLLSPLKITRRGRVTRVGDPVCIDDRPDTSSPFPVRRIDSRLSTRKQLKDVQIPKQQAQQPHARRLEIGRRRANAAAAAQGFFDRINSLPIRDAIDIFEAQHEALLAFCLQQFRTGNLVDAEELEPIQSEFVKLIEKEDKELQKRLKEAQQEETQAATKKKALIQLKASQQEQIEQHLANAKSQRKQDLAARDSIKKYQESLDKSFEARVAERKQLVESNSAKLSEQLKSNVIARSTFQLTAQGSTSPLYRTPWWSDESDERLQGFQRPTTVQWPSQSPVIHSKKRCQWYD